jgi:hypothetical protein
MGSVIPFAMRYARQTSGDVGAHGKCRQNAPDCLWNSAEPPGDIFDKMVARIRVARCYILAGTLPRNNGWRDVGAASQVV